MISVITHRKERLALAAVCGSRNFSIGPNDMIHLDYGLGIDAGGTYTDAVVLNFASGKVIASCKAATTQPDPYEYENHNN